VPTVGAVVSPGAERVGSVVSQKEFARRSSRLAKCICTMERSRIEVSSDSLKSAGAQRRPGSSRPARGFLANCKSRSNYAACDRSLVREREPEFYRDGKERRRQFLKATELNDVCFRLWLRERLRSSEQIKPSVVYILVGTQLPRLSDIGFSGIN